MNYRNITKQNTNQTNTSHTGYVSDSVHHNERVISGFFPKTNVVKEMAIEKVNKTLCGLLVCAILTSLVSYYFVVTSEIKLNECSRKTTLLNVENAELQNKLDKLKSFNNVDLTMQKNNLLQRPEKVIETIEVKNENDNHKRNTQLKNSKPKVWAIGY